MYNQTAANPSICSLSPQTHRLLIQMLFRLAFFWQCDKTSSTLRKQFRILWVINISNEKTVTWNWSIRYNNKEYDEQLLTTFLSLHLLLFYSFSSLIFTSNLQSCFVECLHSTATIVKTSHCLEIWLTLLNKSWFKEPNYGKNSYILVS